MNITITMEKINKGNCQFDTKEAKSFKATCAKYHNAKHTLKDELGQLKERVTNLRAQNKSNSDLIDKLNNGESIIGNYSLADLEQKIADNNAEISMLVDARKDYNDKCKNDTDKLVDALKSVVSAKDYKTITRDEMFLALAQFLSDNGVVPCIETVTRLVNSWGKREGNSNTCATELTLNTRVTYANWIKVTLNELVDLMQEVNALPTHKYTFVPKALRDKK